MDSSHRNTYLLPEAAAASQTGARFSYKTIVIAWFVSVNTANMISRDVQGIEFIYLPLFVGVFAHELGSLL